MYLEYDWSFMVWRPRFGQTFIDVRGARYWPTRRDAAEALAAANLRLGRKTASRTYEILPA